MSITDNWDGWFLNHLVSLEHINYNDPHELPNNIDWNKNLQPGVYLESDIPIDVKFLWGAKIFKLYVDPESEDLNELENPIPIVIGFYDYGEFSGLEPEKQDFKLFSFFKETENSQPELKHYHTIRHKFKSPASKDKMAVNRRKTAEAFLKSRAKTIETSINQVFSAYGAEQATAMGLTKVNLSQGLIDFFAEFSLEMLQFRDSGSLAINGAIQSQLDSTEASTNDWLKISLPIGQNEEGFVFAVAGQVIQKIFADAVSPVTQAEISVVVQEKLAEENL